MVAVPHGVSVTDLIGRLGDRDVVVVDVDGTLVPDRASAEILEAGVGEVLDAAQRSGIGRVLVVSNASRSRGRPGDGVVWEVNKPWTRAARLGISEDDAVAMIGDRVVPDGLLARRLGADFYLMPGPRSAGRPGPGRAAAVLRRFLFRVTPLG